MNLTYLLLMEENNSWMFCKQNNNTLKLLAPTFFYCTNRSTNIFLHVCDTVSTISYCSIFVVKIMDVIWAWNPVEQIILHKRLMETLIILLSLKKLVRHNWITGLFSLNYTKISISKLVVKIFLMIVLQTIKELNFLSCYIWKTKWYILGN